MSFWEPENLRAVTGGRWLVEPAEDGRGAAINGLSTDSRTFSEGQVFCALRGERVDGHDFLEQAQQQGAALLIVDRPESIEQVRPPRCPVLQVDDSLEALKALGSARRRTLTGRVIGVTGSAGKTTTKLLIDAALSSRCRGTVSPRSYNNAIGVPLTLLAAQPGDDYVVVEIGTNAPGEIAMLGRIARPDLAVITTVGAAHLEGLGDLRGVLREKASLLAEVTDGGTAIVNGDVEGLAESPGTMSRTVTFGRSAGCDLRMTRHAVGEGGTRFQINGGMWLSLPMPGEHNALNALAAVAVAREMGLDDETIAAALAHAEPPAMRLEVQRLGPDDGGITLINDAYNANPDSMAAALRVLADHPAPGRRIAVLGDMMELGDSAPGYHRQLGETVVATDIDEAVLIGPQGLYTAEAIARRWPAERVEAIPSWDDATAERIAGRIQPGDTVLIKGSRGMGLERLIPALRQRFEPQPATGG